MARQRKPSTPQVDNKTQEFFEAKLESSGLTIEDAKILGMLPLNAAQTQQLHGSFKSLISMRLNYLDPFGEPLSDWPKAPPFYRIRYLEQGTDFSNLAEKKPPRYVQEPNTAPVAYYPSNCDWPELLDDPDRPIILTEGELKAAKACKEGFPTIGLGGVYNWRSNKLGITWLDSLDYVNWVRRNVYICFDSDLHTNPMVLGALRELADALNNHGAFVYLVYLPQLDELPKVGLDDFLVHAPNANEAFIQMLHEAEPLGLSRVLFNFNSRYIYIRHPGLVLDITTMEKIAPGPFKEHLEAGRQYQERTIKADGTISYRAVAAASEWIKWPLRYQADRLTYAPGADLYIDGSVQQYNIWPGWGVKPAEGDVSLFLQLVDHIFTGAEPGAKDWFLRWCAYPLQHPGIKLFSSCLIHGIRHGTGKSLIGYTLGKIYGKNFTEISQMDLHNGFNEWAEGKQLVMGDDITGSNKRADADFLKKLITQKELRVNGKYMPSYVVPDCINYYFTANGPDSFFLEDDDRRNFIHEVLVGPMSEEFYVEYSLWLDTGGAEAVFQWLLDLDTEDFNPAAPAFKTTARDRMISNVQSDLASWVRSLVAIPDTILKVGEIAVAKDLFTSKELLQFYDPSGKTGTTANGLGRELARAGVRQICHGKPLRTADGNQGRYYAVRNAERWATAAAQDAAKHLDGWNGKQAKGAKY